MASWLYFLANKENKDNGLLKGHDGEEVNSTSEAFKKLAINNNLEDDYWGGIREYFEYHTGRKSGINYGVDINDEVFVAARSGIAGYHVEIIGYALVKNINYKDKEIFLNFDQIRSKCYSLKPRTILIHRQGAFSNLLPLDESTLKKIDTEQKFILDEDLKLKNGKSSRKSIPENNSIVLDHDCVLKNIMDLFISNNFKTGKSAYNTDPKTDLICQKQNITVIAEIKTNKYGESASAVREAFAQLFEYRWNLIRNHKDIQPQMVYLLAAFQNKPNDLSIEFLESNNILVLWYEKKKVNAQRLTKDNMRDHLSIVI